MSSLVRYNANTTDSKRPFSITLWQQIAERCHGAGCRGVREQSDTMARLHGPQAGDCCRLLPCCSTCRASSSPAIIGRAYFVVSARITTGEGKTNRNNSKNSTMQSTHGFDNSVVHDLLHLDAVAGLHGLRHDELIFVSCSTHMAARGSDTPGVSGRSPHASLALTGAKKQAHVV